MQTQLPLRNFSPIYQSLLNNPNEAVQFGPYGFQFISDIWGIVAAEAYAWTLFEGHQFGTTEFERVYAEHELTLVTILQDKVKEYAQGRSH